MATLVLSTVGNALGGPVGGAIGALIGQSIDQQVLGSPRRGPRVGDLAVQSSSYGTQIPRLYGTMRVAGSVIWSTDLIESEQTDGAKGQPDVTYSYSVSFAVALSSRAAKSIKRIWADGKLLRGEAGDFKVGTEFRFYPGSEDQAIDPLIGSIEGIANTPAYRGLAIAVFENLQLAEFGNRIPFLTFEVEADERPPSVGAVLGDASGGTIQSDAGQEVVGFAAYGSSIKSAVEPLVDCFGAELFDDGTVLHAASSLALAIDENELGNSSDNSRQPRLHREQLPVSAVPAAVRLTYYDPARDYQTGEARAVAGEQGGIETQQELPAVLSASDAKSLAQQMIARAWARRDKLTLRLPPKRLALQPGSQLRLPFSPSLWTIEKTSIDGFVVVAELRPTSPASAHIAGDPGRIVANDDTVAGPLTLALLDIPDVLGLAAAQPVLLIAASSATGAWKRWPVQISFGGQTIATHAARGKSLLGTAATVLGASGTDLIDDLNSVEVVLIDTDQWLTSCDDDALAAGDNLAVLGSELIQFGEATPLGSGRFRLTHLLRGRGGTEWAYGDHAAGEAFCVIQAGALTAVSMPISSIGALVSGDAKDAEASTQFAGESVRPLSPVNLQAALNGSSDLVLKWTRRSREGFAWVDAVDAPLGEMREQYRVDVSGTAGSIELVAEQPSLTIAASDLAVVGPGGVTIEVRQIGDLAVSMPAQVTINLP